MFTEGFGTDEKITLAYAFSDSNLSARLMNVTVGMFLLDVELVNLTIEGTTVTVPEAIQHGYLTYEIQYANGSKTYVIQVSFDAPGIKKEVCTKVCTAVYHGVEIVSLTVSSKYDFPSM